MNHRERVLATLDHREPDRVPRYAGLDAEVIDEFRLKTGADDPAEYWDWDIRSVGFMPPDPLPDLKARFERYLRHVEHEWLLDWEHRTYPPEWGVATRPAHMLSLAAPVSPMTTFTSVKELEEYPFPDYLGEWRHDHLEAQVKAIHAAGYPVAAHIGWIFQTGWTLRSEVLLFTDFYENPEFADYLLQRITEIRRGLAIRYAQAGVDMVHMNDDIGGQHSMILSPRMWRQWLKPRLTDVVEAVHAVNPAIHFRYHSDGYYVPVIEDLIDLGVSCLVTLQPEANDIYEIKKRFGDRVSLDGTIGLQSELRYGTPQDVRERVRQQCLGMMANGGWLASPGNGVTADIPFENLDAMFKALDEFGHYGAT